LKNGNIKIQARFKSIKKPNIPTQEEPPPEVTMPNVLKMDAKGIEILNRDEQILLNLL